ncbi:MAG TPA: DUF1801 domain-containing protein [Pyrinomonadaceae bacterium]|nr:DUF1801 domain-containing protein [Pyrinomonadaceae bacterium]
MKNESPAIQVAGFISKFEPAIARIVRESRSLLRTQFPGANELVYDNYNALAIGYSPSERASQAVFSLAVYPRWVDLYFMHGRSLPDPEGLLRGNGKQGAFVRLAESNTLRLPAVRRLIDEALKQSGTDFSGSTKGKTIVKSVSPRQRARRPVKK